MRRLATRVFIFALSVSALAGCYKSPTISPLIPPVPPTRMYVSNFSNGTITAYTFPLSPTAAPALTFATGAALPDPDGMAVDSQNRLFVAYPNQLEIAVYALPLTSSSTPLFVIGPIAGGFFTNTVSFDKAGNLWVASEGNGNLIEFSPPFSSGSTPVLTMVGATSTPPLVNPEQISFDFAGNMAVEDANFGNAALSEVLFYRPPFFSGQTAAATIATGANPVGVNFDVRARMFVAIANGNVQVFTPPFATGNAPAFSIFPPGPPVSATNPFMITFDASGNLYVVYDTDSAAGDVTVFGPPLTATTTPLLSIQNGISSPNIAVFGP